MPHSVASGRRFRSGPDPQSVGLLVALAAGCVFFSDGSWYLNSCDYLVPALAWTGVKHSGRGVSLSTLGFLAVTRPKSVHLRPAP